MEYVPAVVIVIALLLGFNAKDWIETYWKGKSETARENRLAAEANAREAEARLALARTNGTSPTIHP